MKDPNAPMIPFKYFGPYYDYTGYGEANRNIIRALHEVNAPMTTEAVKFATDDNVDFGENLAIAKSYENKRVDYKAKIMHVTPDLYHKNLEAGKYHIGQLFWETDLLPDIWKWNCDLMHEIWTDSELTSLWIKMRYGNFTAAEIVSYLHTGVRAGDCLKLKQCSQETR